ncbi:NAD(+) diphosphatase [Saccharospirillum impatiens]|uniref:NAD(+) diphosphatase n=1 Tax=Saccharospirillum impatiens TaxID=169438 RepID=UPI000400B27C|nr:NAD(+) diphosphatase [Saccharospirillum impatiens]
MLYELGQHNIELPGKAPAPAPADRLMLWLGDELVLNGDSHIHQRQACQFEWEQEEFVGLLDGHSYYTARLHPSGGLRTQALRDVASVSETAFMLAARARGLLDWRRQHRFCGQCGQPTLALAGEPAMVCDPCRLRFYPRVSPCIIVLITRGSEVLLAQGVRNRSRGWYSTLAGFIETGESAEHAVHREVREEVGVEVTNLRYQGSQTWPFPHQLMLGYWADYNGGDIRLQENEIADAGWFSLDALPTVPPGFSIAGWLINRYRQARKAGTV